MPALVRSGPDRGGNRGPAGGKRVADKGCERRAEDSGELSDAAVIGVVSEAWAAFVILTARGVTAVVSGAFFMAGAGRVMLAVRGSVAVTLAVAVRERLTVTDHASAQAEGIGQKHSQ